MTPKEWLKEKMRNTIYNCIDNKLHFDESSKYTYETMHNHMEDFVKQFSHLSKNDAGQNH